MILEVFKNVLGVMVQEIVRVIIVMGDIVSIVMVQVMNMTLIRAIKWTVLGVIEENVLHVKDVTNVPNVMERVILNNLSK